MSISSLGAATPFPAKNQLGIKSSTMQFTFVPFQSQTGQAMSVTTQETPSAPVQLTPKTYDLSHSPLPQSVSDFDNALKQLLQDMATDAAKQDGSSTQNGNGQVVNVTA